MNPNFPTPYNKNKNTEMQQMPSQPHFYGQNYGEMPYQRYIENINKTQPEMNGYLNNTNIQNDFQYLNQKSNEISPKVIT